MNEELNRPSTEAVMEAARLAGLVVGPDRAERLRQEYATALERARAFDPVLPDAPADGLGDFDPAWTGRGGTAQ